MNRIKGIILLLSIVMIIGACSNDENEQNNENEKDNNVIENANNSNWTESNDNELDNDEQEVAEDEANQGLDFSDHQKGLKVGETGTVVSGTLSDNNRYEVTLNKIEQLTEVEGETNYNEVFIKANVTIKNTEEVPLSMDSIFTPTVGDEDLEDIELFPEFKKVIYTDDGSTAFEGNEIAPGEKVIVDYYFDTVKADYYRFAFGNPIDQIVTFANWKIKTEDM